ncbi:MAG: lysine/arginine/ornithine ABC transporter substrate-binding protein [Gammaproteobacteria bacterium]|jgi:arginine transport system substrate-binding protein
MNQLKKIFILISCVFGIIISTNCIAKITNINFATEATYPPFEYFTPNGKIQGFDIDVMNAVCKEIGAACTITHQPFDSLIPSLKLGKFDAVIAALAITAERAKQVDFTNPYYIDTVHFVAAKKSKLVISNDGLKGKIIGVQGGTTFQKYIKDIYGNIVKIKPYESNEQGLLDLKNERIDAYFCDTPFIMQWFKKGNDKDYAIVGKPIENQKYFGDGNGIAVKKGNKKLLGALNKAIAKLKANGTLKKLEQKYFDAEQS